MIIMHWTTFKTCLRMMIRFVRMFYCDHGYDDYDLDSDKDLKVKHLNSVTLPTPRYSLEEIASPPMSITFKIIECRVWWEIKFQDWVKTFESGKSLFVTSWKKRGLPPPPISWSIKNVNIFSSSLPVDHHHRVSKMILIANLCHPLDGLEVSRPHVFAGIHSEPSNPHVYLMTMVRSLMMAVMFRKFARLTTSL